VVSPLSPFSVPAAAGVPPWPDPEIGRWVTLPPREEGQVPLVSWFALPPQGPPRAALLVLPEVFGVNAWLRSVAGRLALAGYAALALPLFSRTAPRLELGYDEAALREGRSHKDRTTSEDLVADLTLAADWLSEALPDLPEGPGCVGFCFGGHVAMLAASLPRVRASCAFYGAGVATGRPGGGPPTLDSLATVSGRLLCVCGRQDELIPPQELAAIEAALGTASQGRRPGEEHRLLTLEAGHGFLCEARKDFHPTAAAAGWKAMLAFFAESLG